MCVDAGDSYDVDSALMTAVKISALFARDFRWSFLCKFLYTAANPIFFLTFLFTL